MTAREWAGFAVVAVAAAGAAVFVLRSKQVDAPGLIDVSPPPDVGATRAAPRRTVVPALVGLRRREAWARIGDALLAVEATTDDAGPAKAGIVFAQDPPAGTKTTSGAIVKVRVGKEPDPADSR